MADVNNKWTSHLSARERQGSLHEQPEGGISEPGEHSWLSGPMMDVHQPKSQNRRKRRSPPPPSVEEVEEKVELSQVSQAECEGPSHISTPGCRRWTLWKDSQPKIRQNQKPHSSPASEHERPPKMMRQPETRPISQDQLVAEVKSIYAGLVMVETKCIEVDKSQSTLSNEQWQSLVALHRTLLHEHHDFFAGTPLSTAGASKGLLPEYLPTKLPAHQDLHQYKIRDRLREFSLKSRTWRRLNDRLVPMLRREQDLESSQQWSQVMKLTSSLLELLDGNDSMLDDANTALLEAFAQVEAILHRLKLRFRRRYDELRQSNGPTELDFEFPNNIRHICTTMPWTIAPALLVLWGVCWMFVASHPSVYERPVTAPGVSPRPTLYHFLDDLSSTDIGAEIGNTGYTIQPSFDSFTHNDLNFLDPLFDPLGFLPASVPDSNCLALDSTTYKSDFDPAVPQQDTNGIEQLSKDMTLDPAQQTCQTLYQQPSSSGQESRSHCTSQQTEPRFLCPDCQQPFATSFTLNRHRAEAYSESASAAETSFPCPSSQCKRSKERSPFKRLYNLNRHLETCRYGRNIMESQEGREPSLTISITTSTSYDEDPSPQSNPAEGSRSNGKRKRARSEDDDDELGGGGLVHELRRKYKRMSEEFKEKEEKYLREQREYFQARSELELMAKIISSLKDPQLDP